MAFGTIKFKNKNGAVKEAPVGFSWTTFFVGFFVPLSRGDWMWTLIMFVAMCITIGFANIIFPFIYNRLYIDGLLKQGYTVKSYIGDKGSIESSAQIKLSNSRQESASYGSDANFESASSEKSTSRTSSSKASKSNDFTGELEELKELYEDGTLSEEQFKKAKNKLLK